MTTREHASTAVPEPVPIPVSGSRQNPSSSFDVTESSNSLQGPTMPPKKGCRVVGEMILLSAAAIALLCSIFTTLSCNFFVIDGIPSDETPITNGTNSVGIFSYATSTVQSTSNPFDFTSCIPYENQFWLSDFGPFFWTAQIAAFLAPCCGGLAFMIQLVEVMQSHLLANFYLSIFFYLMASIFQGYTFAIYAEMDVCFQDGDFHCPLSDAGYVSVAATALYYCCLILMCFLPRHSLLESSTTKPLASPRQATSTIVAHTKKSSINLGERSVRFEDPPVSQMLVIDDNDDDVSNGKHQETNHHHDGMGDEENNVSPNRR